MKSTLAILAALAIGAGSLKADDFYSKLQQQQAEFEQRQFQNQAEFNRRNYEFEQESIRGAERAHQEQNERRFRDYENRLNRIYDLDFE